ncbi:glycerate kinase family protein [Vibrio rumoiensis]|uniref:Glycerate kinase n=1 Tax=Vibrio rumoiensis 1S-45 TaxID=1188252 RepID=A0A1E5E3F1_9VIBR|nr:glycerate kinase [Vibrio rumoiensis]OEF25865.1 glycerate kinase [Vibrio rumoiensis 1S-45]
MKIIIAPDSFKESLTAKQVCQAIENGLVRVWQDAEFVHIPVADGGEGTVQSLVDATNGAIIECQVKGPLGDTVEAFYGRLGGEHAHTAVIEMAAASGLHHVPPAKRDPKATSSFGTGELISHALNQGATKLIIGLGGSATNDGGMGMLEALGVQFLDKQENAISGNGIGLTKIESLSAHQLDPRLANCDIVIACDVDNPLCGEHGATATFGKQKGATEEDTKLLDDALNHYADLVEALMGKSIKNIAGAGAAGGSGAAFLGFTNATLKPGIQIVLETLAIDRHLEGADLVFTGEGRIDWQSAHGKTPVGVAQAAKAFNLPVIALAGGLGDNYQAVYEHGIDAVFAATPRPFDLSTAFEEAGVNMANLAENVARVWQCSQRS